MSNGESAAGGQVHFLFEMPEMSKIEFRVVDFTATEGMSSPYRVELTLASLTEDEDEVSFDAVIGMPSSARRPS